jgi:hypothetical protein
MLFQSTEPGLRCRTSQLTLFLSAEVQIVLFFFAEVQIVLL